MRVDDPATQELLEMGVLLVLEVQEERVVQRVVRGLQVLKGRLGTKGVKEDIRNVTCILAVKEKMVVDYGWI